MANVKQIGTAFEREVVELLSKPPFDAWVHFITPDERGAQPFDIIAVKNCIAYAIECKTLDMRRRWFTLDRLEDNQIMAFNLWKKKNNTEPLIFVKHGEEIKVVSYSYLLEHLKVDMNQPGNTFYTGKENANGDDVH